MFERRLKLLLLFLALPATVVAMRLAQLQVRYGDYYVEQTEQLLELEPRLFPFVRGAITDYEGRPLAHDIASWDIAVHYAVMVENPSLRKLVFTRLGVKQDEDLPERIAESWRTISELTGQSLREIQTEAERIVRRVDRMKQAVIAKAAEDRRAPPTEILEEVMPHPVVTGLDQTLQVTARVALADYPWIEIAPSHVRRYEGGASVSHLVGKLGVVPEAIMEQDPNADDKLARYLPEDLCGLTGVEQMAEQWLRGRRGSIHENRKGESIEPPVAAQNGKDVRLTIDLALQQELYARLGKVIQTLYPASTGGSMVLLDVPSRQVLALISYPSVDPHDPHADLSIDPEDERRQPWLFRAVRRPYNPGSIIKPLFLAGAMSDGRIHLNTNITCRGHLFSDFPDRYRCTGIHGPIGPIYALQHSCNIFFYTVGEDLGVAREVYWLRRFGFGQRSGTGLVDELPGNLPTNMGRGEARFAAIGQGQLEITPIQAANMMATIATGTYQPVSIWSNDPEPRPAPTRLPIPDSVWRVVRQGMYEVVNEPGGTAYGRAQLTEPGDYVLLGKTGSAESPPPEWIYTCRFPDGRIRHIRSRNRTVLLAQYPKERRPEVIEQNIPEEYDVTHGWFTGYLTTRRGYREPARGGDLCVAFAVVVEYAGHGGEVAAPIAADVIDTLLRRQRGEPLRLETPDGGT